MSLWAAGFWATGFWADGFWAESDAPAVEPASNAAGRPSRRRRYFVEIDGQEFDVSGPEEALELLNRAKKLAAYDVEQKRNISARVMPGVRMPQIRTPNKELVPVVQQARKEIRDLYAGLKRDLEIRFLMAKREEEEEEEAIIRLLM